MNRRLRQTFLLFTTMLALGRLGHAQALPEVCKDPYSQQQEIDLGNKVVREVYQQMPVLPDSDPVAQYVRQLGARLVAAAPSTPGLERQWPFNFHVVASSEINAFALPGGAMFVNLGAIQAAENESQLAGVMGHEMSHVILRHSTCNLVKQQNRGILYSLGQLGAAAVLGGTGGNLAAQGIGLARNLNFLQMSRGDEKQADLLGVQIVYDAGLDPRGLPQFFEIIEAKTGQRGAQFLSDHPNPGNRTEYLNRAIALLPPRGSRPGSSPAFSAAHTTAATRHALTAQETQAGQWRSSGLYATGPGSAGGVVQTSAPASGAGSSAARSGAGRLSGADLGLNAPFKRVQGATASIGAPANWVRSGTDPNQGLTLAPPGGAGSFGTAYGVLLGTVQQNGAGTSDLGGFRAASDTYASQLMQASGLAAESGATALQIAGQPAISRYLRGTSPVAGAGAERDWLVTVARPDGDMNVLIFVAPADQFSALQTTFQRMLESFRTQ